MPVAHFFGISYSDIFSLSQFVDSFIILNIFIRFCNLHQFNKKYIEYLLQRLARGCQPNLNHVSSKQKVIFFRTYLIQHQH